ncbi:MAG: PP2C family protein-serine/threonine phosphatase [Bacteroidota bacterium]
MPSQHNQHFKSFFSTLQDDLRNSNAYATFRKESKEVTDFYLTDPQREELKRMKRIKGSFYITGWVLKAMFYKLTPLRRIMFVIGTLLLININVTSNSIQGNGILGSFFLILVILLELKDKLLAHDELEAGRKIQETLMPERTPNVNGWSLWLYTRSANEVCGDLIDFMKLEPGAFSIAMADVSGKGLHAALITAKLQATIRALAGEIRSLPELIGRINSIVHRDSPSHIFSSLVYMECSEVNGTIRYVNAGHFPALIIRGTAIQECAKGDAALGLIGTMKFAEQSVTLNSGDAIVLYSDGLTEAQNASGEFFGKDRLFSILTSTTGAPEERGFAVLRDVDRFTGTASPTDDLSLIIALKT